MCATSTNANEKSFERCNFRIWKIIVSIFFEKKKRQNKLKNGIELHSKKAIAFRLVVSHDYNHFEN